MSLFSTQHSAELQAIERLDNLRKEIILAVNAATSLSGWAGTSLRTSVGNLIKQAGDGIKSSFNSFLNEGWSAGSDRADKAYSNLLKELSPPELTPQMGEFSRIVNNSFDSLFKDLQSKVDNILTRASLSDGTKEDVIEQIGARVSDGIFDRFSLNAAGIVSHEVGVVESFAYGKRSAEIEKQAAFKESYSKKSQLKKQPTKKAVANKLQPMTITVWAHSPAHLTARPGHLALDGCGVPVNGKFHLHSTDGNVYKCTQPKLPPLPIGDQVNCRCRTYPVVIWVTEEQKKQIEIKAKGEGGYRSELWSK